MRRILLISAAILVGPGAVVGQDSALVPGQTVRITAHRHDLRRTLVTLVGIRSDSIQVQYTRKRLDHGSVVTDSLLQAVPLAAVSKLEIQAGRRSNWDKGARTGAIVAGVLGVLMAGLGAAACGDEGGMFCAEPTARVTGILTVGLAGGLVGALIGAMSSREAWREVSVGRTRIGVVPLGRGFAVTASLRF